jgi:hypothetical protein
MEEACPQSQWLPYTPEDIQNALSLHPINSTGYVTLCNKTTRWSEINVHPSDLEYALKQFSGIDSYISQNRFKVKKRLTATLKELNALWVDIDFYKKPDLCDKHWGYVLDLALYELHIKKIPEPNLAISSGRGLYLIWFIEPEGIDRLPDWQKLQNHITTIMNDIGGDMASRPPTQVLRIVGSQNSKSNNRVEIVFSGNDYRWNLDDLLYEIDIPTNKTKIESIEEIASRSKKKVSNFFAPRFFTQKTLWALRYQEIRNIIDYRYPYGIEEGFRDTFLFISSVALSWIVEDCQSIENEIRYLAKRCLGRFTDSDIKSTFAQSIERLNKSKNGESIVWQGTKKDPRYFYKTETIVKLLDVSIQEAINLNLRSIVPERLRKEREAYRARENRVKNGTKVQLYRGVYTPIDESIESLKPWIEEGISRRTWFRRRNQYVENLKFKSSN